MWPEHAVILLPQSPEGCMCCVAPLVGYSFAAVHYKLSPIQCCISSPLVGSKHVVDEQMKAHRGEIG